MLDNRIVYCIKELEKNGYKIQFIGEDWGYRNFDKQLELFSIGRDNEIFEVEEKLVFGKKLLRLADKGVIRLGTVTNATPCTSPHNFGMAIDCKDSDYVCEQFNKIIGYELFVTGKDFNDVNHIEIKDFKIPKYEYRWSIFCTPFGYDFLEKIGGLKNV